MLADQPTVDELRREIDRLGRRVAELERENEVLRERNEERFDAVPRDAFDSIRDGVALYDAGDRLVFFNDRYVELYELIADRIVAGTTFEALGVAAIELGLFPGDGDSQRVRFERRAANREIRRGVIDIECAGGVWRRISERRTSDGGMVSVHSDITEEMERERAIREHRDKLRLLTDSLPAVVGYLDADRRHQLFNRTGREWFDLDGAQDSRDLDIAPPLGAAGGHPLHDRLRAAFAGETIVFEETMSFPDGETRDVEVSYVPDRADDGSVRGIFSLAANITERNRVAAALRENERRFRDFALATSDWLWEADANFRITWGATASRIRTAMARRISLARRLGSSANPGPTGARRGSGREGRWPPILRFAISVIESIRKLARNGFGTPAASVSSTTTAGSSACVAVPRTSRWRKGRAGGQSRPRHGYAMLSRPCRSASSGSMPTTGWSCAIKRR